MNSSHHHLSKESYCTFLFDGHILAISTVFCHWFIAVNGGHCWLSWLLTTLPRDINRSFLPQSRARRVFALLVKKRLEHTDSSRNTPDTQREDTPQPMIRSRDGGFVLAYWVV